MGTEAKYVSGSNYYNEKDLNNMIEELDKGNAIKVGIECIGHTRNNMTQEQYKEALYEHYGTELKVVKHTGYCSYEYEYELK